MKVLLLRLAGPMQSWGTQSRFSHRDTGLEPSKSGVVGLLGAALGVGRDDVAGIARLASLKLAIRVDREGRLLRDYHTAMDVIKSDGGKPPKGQAVLSERYYLADADFLVGLAGPVALLHELATRLDDPVWPLFLGRKSFVPGQPPIVGFRDGPLLEALKREPRPTRWRRDQRPAKLRFVWDVEFKAGEPGHETRQDVPLSFSPRRFGIRHVKVDFFEATTMKEPQP